MWCFSYSFPFSIILILTNLFILTSSYGYETAIYCGVGHHPKMIVGSTYDQSEHSPTPTPSKILCFWRWSHWIESCNNDNERTYISSLTLCDQASGGPHTKTWEGLRFFHCSYITFSLLKVGSFVICGMLEITFCFSRCSEILLLRTQSTGPLFYKLKTHRIRIPWV